MTFGTGNCGYNTKKAGTCTNPPPPTMLSIKPAIKANAQSRYISIQTANVTRNAVLERRPLDRRHFVEYSSHSKNYFPDFTRFATRSYRLT
jgi:hypothetical protein